MKKVFEHTDIRGRISERLDVNECGGGIYFAIHTIEESPIGDICDERRLSTVIPYSEMPELIESLVKTTGVDSKLYYLQDSRSFNGNYMMFWGIDDKGYTSDIRKAQTYTLAEAKKRGGRETDIPRKVSDMQSLLRHCVDYQDLRKINQEEA